MNIENDKVESCEFLIQAISVFKRLIKLTFFKLKSIEF